MLGSRYAGIRDFDLPHKVDLKVEISVGEFDFTVTTIANDNCGCLCFIVEDRDGQMVIPVNGEIGEILTLPEMLRELYDGTIYFVNRENGPDPNGTIEAVKVAPEHVFITLKKTKLTESCACGNGHSP